MACSEISSVPRTSGEKGAKKKQSNGFIDLRYGILNQLIPGTFPAWVGQVGTICDLKALSPHGTTGYFSIADTDSTKPTDKRARKGRKEYTKAAQALGVVCYPGTPVGSKGPIEASILRHGSSATRPRTHEVSGFVVGALANSRPSAPSSTTAPLGFRRLPTSRVMESRLPGRLLTCSAREFDAFEG